MHRILLALIIAALVLSGCGSGKNPQQIPPTVTPQPVCSTPPPGYAGCLSEIVPATVVAGFSPTDFHLAYNLPVSAPYPQTIALVDAYDAPNIEADLALYSERWGLLACTQGNGCLRVLDQHGGHTLPAADDGWANESTLDVEIAHGICQTCALLLIEADSPSLANLSEAVQTAARLGATEISNSYGGTDTASDAETAAYDIPGVAVTASSGDDGYGVEFPAALPSVVAVGGTSLRVNGDGSYRLETAWSKAGSGCSQQQLAAAWQLDVEDWTRTGCGDTRGVADISADADPQTGAAIVYKGTWETIGGTSLSAPLIAGVFALAGGVPSGVEGSSLPYQHPDQLHDVMSGSNGSCTGTMCVASYGYDGPTGLGSPNGLGAFGVAVAPTPTPAPTEVPPPTATATATATATTEPNPTPTVAPLPTATPTAVAVPTPTATLPPPPPPPPVPTVRPTATPRPKQKRHCLKWIKTGVPGVVWCQKRR